MLCPNLTWTWTLDFVPGPSFSIHELGIYENPSVLDKEKRYLHEQTNKHENGIEINQELIPGKFSRQPPPPQPCKNVTSHLSTPAIYGRYIKCP